MTHSYSLRTLHEILGKSMRPTAKGWYNFCHKRCSDKKFRLGVNFNNGRYKCFNCGASGLLKDLIPGLKGEIVPPDATPPPPPPRDLPWREITAGPAAPSPLAKAAIDYLASRGIPLWQAERLGLGYGTKGCWLGRVIHPYFDVYGGLAGWQGRTTYDPEPGDGTRKIRFATRRDMPAKYNLLTPGTGAVYSGGGNISAASGAPVLLVEGPYDAIQAQRMIESYGLFGSQLSEAQMSRVLARRPRAVYIGLDRDKSGRSWNKDAKRWEPDPRIKMARMLYTRTAGLTPIYIVEYPDSFKGDFGGREDKTPHPREELLPLITGARRWRPGASAPL